MDDGHAWFRGRVSEPWHEILHREDLDLVARCGYTRSWTKSEQARGVTPPGTSCADCDERRAALPEHLAVSAHS